MIFLYIKFQGEKHIYETFLTKWNMLTPRSIILVVEIDVNTNFLSLLLKFDDLSLFSFKSRTKK